MGRSARKESDPKRHAFEMSKHTWGLLKRRECLVPTLRGWMVLLLLTGVLVLLVLSEAHTFLTINDRIPSDILVIEGWLPDYAVQDLLADIQRNHYRKVLVTGGPMGTGRILCGYSTWAELGAATLIKLGMDTNTVEALSAAKVSRDRTYASGVALHNWLLRHQIETASLNILTMAEHSRRTRFLFGKALGPKYRLGIISVQNLDYDPNRWWKSSEGVRGVIGEMLAYGYARLLFWPPAQAE
jgi:hypothetical protein